MKNLKKITSFLMLALIVSSAAISFTSCKNDNKKEEKKENATMPEAEEWAKKFDEKMKETIQIHDDVMPEMERIQTLLSKLEDKKEDLSEKDFQRTTDMLKEGHQMMMDWMKTFGKDFNREEINKGIQEKDPEKIEAKYELLEKHHQKAEMMQKRIEDGIKQAEKILSEE
ncbi:MAG: hypothetical protein ACQESK_04695 [Bacteroidota bacterium]